MNCNVPCRPAPARVLWCLCRLLHCSQAAARSTQLPLQAALQTILSQLPEVEALRAVTGAYVPVMEMKVRVNLFHLQCRSVSARWQHTALPLVPAVPLSASAS